MIRAGKVVFSTILWGVLLLVAGVWPATAQVAYTLDPGHTQVHFTWNHLGLSNPGATFGQTTGKVIWNEADPTQSAVEVSMAGDSINTYVPVLDADFKSAKFFDMSRFPAVTFKSSKIERIGISNHYKIFGELIVRDISKPVVLDATLNGAREHPMIKAPALGFDATTTLKRSKFGLTIALPAVSDEIRVRITGEAVESQAYERAMKAMAEGKRP